MPRRNPDRAALGSREPAPAVSPEDREGAALDVGGDDVEPPVPVQVRERERIRLAADTEGRARCRTEPPSAVAEQHRHDVRLVVRGEHVEGPVAVDVAEGETVVVGLAARERRVRRAGRAPEPARAVAEPDEDTVAVVPRRDQVRHAVPVEVTGLGEVWRRRDRKRRARRG
jgi:hypothetical protein